MEERAIRLRVMIEEDHLIRLPDEVPVGSAEIIVLLAADGGRSRKAEARKRMFGRLRGQATLTEDFDAPLPDDVLRDFEGGGSL
jgi:hypothetical protein